MKLPPYQAWHCPVRGLDAQRSHHVRYWLHTMRRYARKNPWWELLVSANQRLSIDGSKVECQKRQMIKAFWLLQALSIVRILLALISPMLKRETYRFQEGQHIIKYSSSEKWSSWQSNRIWLVVDLPLWKIWLRQWGWDDIPYINICEMENDPVMFETTNQWLLGINHD